MIAWLPARYRRPPPPPGQAALVASLRPWEQRLAFEALSRFLLYGMIAALGLASLILLIGWFTLIPEADLRPWAAAAVPLPLLSAAVLAIWPRAHRLHVSRLDERLRLNDRLATAWSLRTSDAPIVSLQRSDALDNLALHDPGTELGWRPRRLHLIVLGAAAVITLLLLGTPSPQQSILDQQAADALAVQQASARLDALREAADASSDLTPDQARQLDELLQQAQNELSRTRTQQEASSVLARTQDQVAQQLGDPNADLRDEALAAMSETLATEPRTQPLADALQREDARGASQALSDIAAQSDQLSDVERQALSRALQRAANVGRSDPRTASALRDAAQAIASRASARDALSQADAAVRDSLQASQSQAALNQTVRQLRDMQSRLASGQPLGSSEDVLSQASAPANSSDSPSGTPVALDARGGARTVSDPTASQGNASGAGTDPALSLSRGNAPPSVQSAENVFVPGRASTGLADQQDVVDQPFSVRGAPRPYREVLSQYAQTSRDYVDRPDISPAVRDLVKQYFQDLEQGQ
jgi:hypothetical protein